jgi:murein hydrolase activator
MTSRPAIALLLAVFFPLVVYAAEPDAPPPPNVITIGKLREEISSHQEKIEQTGKQEHSLLDDLTALDNKIGQQKAKIETIRAKLKEQQQVIAAKEQDLALLSRKTESLRQHLIKRLRSFYLLGKTGFLNIVFSSTSLPDLILADDAFRSLVTYDQAVFEEYRTSILEIDRAKRAHELEQSVHEHFLADAAKENSLLLQTAEEKNAVLKRIRTEKGLYEQAIREMKKAEGTLLATLAKSVPVADVKLFGFTAQKKKLPPPVYGKITRRFMEPSPDEEETTFANGITIAPPDRAEVFAVYGGMVIFAGYMSGYGKVIIVEHDQQYYTVTARLDDIQVQEGDTVKQGQIIGTTGDVASLFGQGLYFEIRHGAQPENPLDWMQPGSLSGR